MSAKNKDTRSEFIEAALKLFAEHGYDGASIRMIAQQAGRPISLIGHHFGSKEGIYLEVFRYLTTRSMFSMEEVAFIPPKTKVDAVRIFREQIHSLYAEVCPDDPAKDDMRKQGNKLFLWEMRNPRPEIQVLLQKQLQPWVNKLKACIQVMRPDLSEDEIIFLGSSIMIQVAGQSLLEGVRNIIWGAHGIKSSRSAELLAEFSLQGLGIR